MVVVLRGKVTATGHPKTLPRKSGQRNEREVSAQALLSTANISARVTGIMINELTLYLKSARDPSLKSAKCQQMASTSLRDAVTCNTSEDTATDVGTKIGFGFSAPQDAKSLAPGPGWWLSLTPL
jgi:hypothetical protein